MTTMTRTWAELLLLAVLLLAAWLAIGLRAPSPLPADGGGSSSEAIADDPVGAGLAHRTRALKAYLAAPPPRGTVRRNPFSFPAPARPAGAPGARQVESAPEPPPRPTLTLSGIAEEAGSDGPVRTAVIVSSGKLLFAKEGDRVLTRFVVLRIAADAVQLRDTERGEVFTLALK